MHNECRLFFQGTKKPEDYGASIGRDCGDVDHRFCLHDADAWFGDLRPVYIAPVNLINRGVIYETATGAISSFQGRSRFTSLGANSVALGGFNVYCPDLKIRKLLGYTSRRMVRPYIGMLLGNTFWSGFPTLSDPIGDYDLSELRSVVKSYLREDPCADDFSEKDLAPETQLSLETVEAADSFEEIFAQVPRL